LLRYNELEKNADALKLAKIAAERLLQTAEKQKTGTAWPTLKETGLRLGGISHGATGIAWALAEWAKHKKSKKLGLLIEGALAYEQTLFDMKSKSWIDLRQNKPTYAWCHGAPGIGLAATKIYEILKNNRSKAMIGKAQKATWKHGLSGDHCLCHGALGNIEVFVSAKDNNKIENSISKILNAYQTEKIWRCGLPGRAETPGLMCGLAGIGFGLLRLFDPAKVPNILLLDVPSKNSAL
jgi:lantibiotic modifying enzyme